MKDLSIKELILRLRECTERETCFECPFIRVEDCITELMKAAADKLEELIGAGEDAETRLTARDGEYAYFKKCFDEPCLGNGCNDNDCDFMRAVCEKLCRYEEGAILGDMEKALHVPKKRRCATCAHEERMAEEERCRKCEKHSLWEERK